MNVPDDTVAYCIQGDVGDLARAIERLWKEPRQRDNLAGRAQAFSAAHRWSDGSPFTTEDFRYWWEDVANNTRLSPGGPPQALLPGGEPPRIEILSETEIRYSWNTPNPTFLPALADAQPLALLQHGVAERDIRQ